MKLILVLTDIKISKSNGSKTQMMENRSSEIFSELLVLIRGLRNKTCVIIKYSAKPIKDAGFFFFKNLL